MDNTEPLSNTTDNHPVIIGLQDKLSMCNFQAKALAALAADDEFALFAEDTRHGCLLALRDLITQACELSHQLWKHHAALLQKKS